MTKAPESSVGVHDPRVVQPHVEPDGGESRTATDTTKTGVTSGSGEKRTTKAGVTDDSSKKDVTKSGVAADSSKKDVSTTAVIVPAVAEKTPSKSTAVVVSSKPTFKSALKNLGDLLLELISEILLVVDPKSLVFLAKSRLETCTPCISEG